LYWCGERCEVAVEGSDRLCKGQFIVIGVIVVHEFSTLSELLVGERRKLHTLRKLPHELFAAAGTAAPSSFEFMISDLSGLDWFDGVPFYVLTHVCS
jgi:hypothetical protein